MIRLSRNDRSLLATWWFTVDRGLLAAILVLAWLKARVILNRYLGLAGVPGARRGFGAGLGAFALAALVLYALG